MSHGPATEWGEDKAARAKMRVGILLLAIYTVAYASFVLINVLAPGVMDVLVGEQNLATVWGMGLIGLAFIFGLLYTHLCSRAEDRAAGEG